MAVDKPTVRAQEALAAAAALAGERAHQAIEPPHLLLALLDAREGVVAPVLERAGADLAGLRAATLAALERLPVVHGATQQHLSPAFRDVVQARRRGGRAAERRVHLHGAPADRAAGRALPGARRAHGQWRDDRAAARRAGAGPRLGAGHRPEPRGQVPGARALRARPDRPGRAGQARPGHRPGRGGPPRDPGAVAAHQEQPRPDRRAGRGQDGHRRGPGPAHRRRRRARGPAGQARRRPRRRRPHRRRQVPGRVRGPAQGRPQGDRRLRRPGDPLHRRAAHDRRAPGRPRARSTPRTC